MSKRRVWTFLTRLWGSCERRAYGEKVAASVVGQLRPKWQELTAKASELEAAKKAEREARATVDDQNKRLRPIVDALRPLNGGQEGAGLDRG